MDDLENTIELERGKQLHGSLYVMCFPTNPIEFSKSSLLAYSTGYYVVIIPVVAYTIPHSATADLAAFSHFENVVFDG